jgi:signal transduction histidine kinase
MESVHPEADALRRAIRFAVCAVWCVLLMPPATSSARRLQGPGTPHGADTVSIFPRTAGPDGSAGEGGPITRVLYPVLGILLAGSLLGAAAFAVRTWRGGKSREVEAQQEELRRLQKRLQELMSGIDQLKAANIGLQEQCNLLNRTNQELQELHRRKEELLAGLAHDIKNPAGAIQMLAEMLQSYDLSVQDQQKFISDILLTSARVVRLSKDLSRIVLTEIRSLPLEIARTALPPLLERVCVANQVLADRKEVTIRRVLPDDLPEIELDAARIEEVLDNLISNAVKYSRADSTVRVEVRTTPDQLVIEVSDTGVGLSQSDIKEAFQFGRVLSSRPTGGEEATGMGLWMVRKIVEAHHGAVGVRSVSGQGSTFSISIPLAAAPGAAGG